MPLIAHVDLRTGAVNGPVDLRRPSDGTSEASAIVVVGDVVWLRTNEHVRCFDPSAGSVTDIASRGRSLVGSGGAVWTIAGDGRPARIRREPLKLEPLGNTRPYYMTVAHGYVWSAAWRDGDTTVLSRMDPASEIEGPSIELPGSPQWLASDDDSLWVYLWRRVPHGMMGALVRVDPEGVAATHELLFESAGAPRGIVRGEVWVQTTDPYAHDQRGLPTTIRRYDGRTGNVVGESELPGWLSWPVSSRDGMWGLLEERGRYPHRVTYLSRDSDSPFVADLASLDVTPFLPPPPGPIDAGEMERKALDEVTAEVNGGWVRTDPETGAKDQRPLIRGVTFEEVRLEGSFPDTAVVALFRSESHPGVLFGRRRRIWADDGAWEGADYLGINLMEDVEACGHGLPRDPSMDESGIAWF